MALTVLDALARFHKIAMIADRGQDLVTSICTFGGDRSQVPDVARTWAREVLEARAEHPEFPDPSDAAELIAKYWASGGSQEDFKVMLEKLITAIHAVANEPFKSSSDSTRRFLLLHELYEAHMHNAGLHKDGLPAMFCTDYQTIERWLKWAKDHYFIEHGRTIGDRGVALTTRGVDMVEENLAGWKREAEKAPSKSSSAVAAPTVKRGSDMSKGKKPRVFIGSSVEGKEIAEQIQFGLDYDAECTIWWQGVFGLSSGTLESLVKAAKDFEFAVLVLTPDDLVSKRDDVKNSPRDNVIFELGLFMGALGRERTYIVHCRDEKPDLPTDLAGVTPATFAKHSDGNLQAAMGAVCTQIKQAINAVLTAARSP